VRRAAFLVGLAIGVTMSVGAAFAQSPTSAGLANYGIPVAVGIGRSGTAQVFIQDQGAEGDGPRTQVRAVAVGAGSWRPAEVFRFFPDPSLARLPASTATYVLRLNERGTLVALVDTPDDGIRLATRRAGAWSTPRTIAAAGAGAPDLAVNDAGEVLVAWVSAGGVVEAQMQTAHGAWGPVHRLSTAGTPTLAPRVALNDAGDALVVWAGQTTSAGPAVWAADRRADGRWSPMRDVSAGEPPMPAHSLALALDRTGDGVVAWAANLQGVTDPAAPRTAIRVADHSAGASRWTAHTLLGGPARASDPLVGMDGGGNAVAVWSDSGGIETAVQSAGGTWRRERVMPDSMGTLGIPQALAVSAFGDAILATSPSGGPLHTFRRSLVGGWREVLPSNSAAEPGPTLTAINDAGDAVLTWNETESDTSHAVDATISKALPVLPTLAGLRAVPSRGLPRLRIVLSRAGPILLSLHRMGSGRVEAAALVNGRRGSSILKLPRRFQTHLHAGQYAVVAEVAGRTRSAATKRSVLVNWP